MIAARRLADYHRKGSVDTRMRCALAIQPRRVSQEDARLIALLGDDAATARLAELPADQREAVAAHVLHDRGYRELATALNTSEAVVRQRVSRGLARCGGGSERGDERLHHRAAQRPGGGGRAP